jgi:SPP1 family predicted phage head-tail adaptor
MGIGNFKHRITFRDYTSTEDGYGGTIDTPVDILSTWAEKDPIRSNRTVSEAQLNLKNTTTFRIRWRQGFMPDTKMKVVYHGRQYVINSVVEDSDITGRFWDITATMQAIANPVTT